jgi:hypothetical protein
MRNAEIGKTNFFTRSSAWDNPLSRPGKGERERLAATIAKGPLLVELRRSISIGEKFGRGESGLKHFRK